MDEMEGITALIAVLVGTIVAALVVRLSSRAASGAPYMPSEPGPSPSGVEEDDDAHWSWTRS